MRISKPGPLFRSPAFWLGIFLLASSILGLSIFQDYGMSFDEPGIHSFTPVALEMYASAFQPPERPIYQRETYLHRSGIDPILFSYGPFYFMAVELFARAMETLGFEIPSWDLWHLAYFITFEAGILVFYLLSRRWLSGWASLGSAILFATQPLIVGHAFMNPKDTPFMFFFMAAIYSGLVMVDKISRQPESEDRHSARDLADLFSAERQTIPFEARHKTIRSLLLLGGTLVLVLLADPVWKSMFQNVVSSIYFSPPDSLPGVILRVLSDNPEDIPLENFIAKSLTWLTRLEVLVSLVVIGAAIWMAYSLFPRSGIYLVQTLSLHFRRFLRCLVNPWVLLAGILLGLTLSIRLFAPLAGGLVLLYLFWKARGRGIYAALAYGFIALVTTYLTWPYLWGAPVRHIIKSWEVMNAFSVQGSRSSLPLLLAFQYTEPAVILAIAGILIAIVGFIRGDRTGLLFLFLGWTVLPLGFLIWKESYLYDNFRQVLFLIPPFFLMAGLAIEKIIHLIRRPVPVVAFIFLICLPGFWADIRLHPYQYIYYNQFIGGVSKASLDYNTDYWATSFKETAHYLNETTPANSSILVCGPVNLLQPFLRTDLKATEGCKEGAGTGGQADLVVIYTRHNIHTQNYPHAEVIYSVNRENAVLAVVKSLKGQSE
jgi:hypothetical protein